MFVENFKEKIQGKPHVNEEEPETEQQAKEDLEEEEVNEEAASGTSIEDKESQGCC